MVLCRFNCRKDAMQNVTNNLLKALEELENTLVKTKDGATRLKAGEDYIKQVANHKKQFTEDLKDTGVTEEEYEKLLEKKKERIKELSVKHSELFKQKGGAMSREEVEEIKKLTNVYYKDLMEIKIPG